MKKDTALELVEYVDDELIEKADVYGRTKKPRGRLKWGAVAACLCVAVIGVIALQKPVAQTEDPELEAEESEKKTEMQEPAPDDGSGVSVIPMVYVRDTLYVAAYEDGLLEAIPEEGELLGIITENILEDPAYPDHVPTKNFQTNQMLTDCGVYECGENIAVAVEGLGYLLFVPYGGHDTAMWEWAMESGGSE